MSIYLSTGVTFARGDAASPEVFTALAQVLSIGAIDLQRPEIRTTNLGSTFASFVRGIKEGQPFDVVLQYDPDDSNHAQLRTDLDGSSSVNYRITLTDSPAQTWTIPAIVTGFRVDEQTEDAVSTATVTLRPTGTAPTVA